MQSQDTEDTPVVAYCGTMKRSDPAHPPEYEALLRPNSDKMGGVGDMILWKHEALNAAK